MKPTFAIVGAPKCGTSELYRRMRLHPEIADRMPKELHYFNMEAVGNTIRADKRRARGFDVPANFTQYKEHFDGFTEPQVGDATPAYLFNPLVPYKMSLRLPDVKLIIILRDPTARLMSHARAWGERQTDSTTMTQDPRRKLQYVHIGHYAEKIRLWRLYYPANQMFIGFTDEMASDPNGFLTRLWSFLGVSEITTNYSAFTPTSPVLGGGRFTTQQRDMLRNYYKPHNTDLAQLTGSQIPETVWNAGL